VCGQGIVDRSAGKLSGTITEDPAYKSGAIRRVVGPDFVVGVVKDGNGFALGNVKLPLLVEEAPTE